MHRRCGDARPLGGEGGSNSSVYSTSAAHVPSTSAAAPVRGHRIRLSELATHGTVWYCVHTVSLEKACEIIFPETVVNASTGTSVTVHAWL